MTATLKQSGFAAVAATAAMVVGFMGSGGRLFGAAPPKNITLTPIGVYRAGLFDQAGAEIAAYDPDSKRLFSVNGGAQRVDVLDISNPSSPFLTLTIPVTAWGRQANSVAVRNGVLAVAVESAAKTDPGMVVFFDAYGGFLSAVRVGALPDMVTFTPNGEMVLVANEGEPNSYGQPDSIDPEGSVSIIDLCRANRQGRDCRPGRRAAELLTDNDVTTVGFAAFNGATLSASIRIFGPGATVAQDLEPEYIAVSSDSKVAWVTLQENNALGILDLRKKRFTKLVGLGFKNHDVTGAGFDASDRDNHAIAIQPRPVLGMYLPDGIDTFEHRGRTFLVTANEGDVREWPGMPGGTEARRVSTLSLDPAAYPNGAALKSNASLGRLNVTAFNGDAGGDGDIDQLYAFGGRSFSVWDDEGRQVFDSGDAFEQITAARNPDWFNANHTNNVNLGNPNDWTHDSRSDDKGSEPENVTVARLFGRQFALVGLERMGGVMIYELTEPSAPRFVDYVNVRTFGVDANTAAAEDLGPEGLIVIPAEDSPNGKPLLVVSNEVSGTTRIFQIGLSK